MYLSYFHLALARYVSRPAADDEWWKPVPKEKVVKMELNGDSPTGTQAKLFSFPLILLSDKCRVKNSNKIIVNLGQSSTHHGPNFPDYKSGFSSPNI